MRAPNGKSKTGIGAPLLPSMKSFWIASKDGGTVLEPREIPVPQPAAGQLLVRMRAVGLNRGELMARPDLHGQSAAARPAGGEGAGEVVRAGGGVTGFQPGERVMAACRGAFAEFALIDVQNAIAVPPNLSWEEAGGTVLVFQTVHDMVTQGGLQAGEWMLITGASSGVGVAALQAAKALGARTIGTSGSRAKLDKLTELGLDVAICTRGPDFHEAVMQATGGAGVNLIINNVGGSVFSACVSALAFEGRLATVGYVDRVLQSTIDIAALHAKRLRIFGVSALLRTPEQRAETVRGFVRDLLPFIADGRIKPVIDRVFRFEDLPAAKAYMESNSHVGKIVARISAD
jgi:NADPH:quinone reductase-like Zn-dependent oxidoreductase